MQYRFVIIDDSELDCYIARKKIEHAFINSDIRIFFEAKTALQFLREEVTVKDYSGFTIILLDILMPLMDGYAFIEEYEQLSLDAGKNYQIVGITSSMYKTQINRIYSYQSVKGVLEKPFTIEKLKNIIDFQEPMIN